MASGAGFAVGTVPGIQGWLKNDVSPEHEELWLDTYNSSARCARPDFATFSI